MERHSRVLASTKELEPPTEQVYSLVREPSRTNGAPGSFYKTGLMPITYNMIAMMENGREILLPDPVEIVEPTTDLEMKIHIGYSRHIVC